LNAGDNKYLRDAIADRAYLVDTLNWTITDGGLRDFPPGGGKLFKPLETPAYLNMLHPHAEGFKAAYLFNDQGGKVFDWTQNQNDLSITNASWVANGLQCDANGEYASLDNTNQVVNSDRGTVILRFKSLGVITDGIIRVIFGRWGGSWSLGDFVIFKYSNDNVYFGFNGAVRRYALFSPSNFPTWQTDIQIAVRWDKDNLVYGANYLAMNVNGVEISPISGDYTTTWNSFTVGGLAIGNDTASTTLYANSIFEYVYIYNKVLSESTLKSIYEDPYSMFYNPTNMFLSLLGSHKSGLKIKQNYYGANAFPIGRGL